MLALLLVGCGVLDGDEDEVMAVWDLRNARSVEAVGWPENAGSSFEATTSQGLERILLPGEQDVVVEGEFRANPSRRGLPGVVPYGDELRALVVAFERESVEEVMERARAHAEQLTRAFPDGDALLRLLVSWRDASAS